MIDRRIGKWCREACHACISKDIHCKCKFSNHWILFLFMFYTASSLFGNAAVFETDSEINKRGN